MLGRKGGLMIGFGMVRRRRFLVDRFGYGDLLRLRNRLLNSFHRFLKLWSLRRGDFFGIDFNSVDVMLFGGGRGLYLYSY